MVVLEGHNMLGVNSANQYLQPDYLSPLPTTLDAKKSPLALLVQTCSQIGADSPNSKSLLHPSPLSSSDSTSSSLSSGSAGQKRKASTDSGHGTSLKSLSDLSNDSSRPRSSGSTSSCSSAKVPRLSQSISPTQHHGKISPKQNNNNETNSVIIHNNNNNTTIQHTSKIRKLSGQSHSENHHHQKSSPSERTSNGNVTIPQGKQSSGSSASSRSPSSHTTTSHHEKSVPKSVSSSSESNKTNSSPKPSNHQQDQGASPIIRSGLDVLQGKDLPKFGGFPLGFDPTNPAFRLPFLASHHAQLLGFPSPAGAFRSGLTAPVCKDPYCSGCQFGGGGLPHGNPGPLSGAPGLCPAGCTQCDHQKFPMIPQAATSGPYPTIPGFPPGLSHAALLSHTHNSAAMAAMLQHYQMAAVQQQNSQKPHLCSWIVGDNYCGKRFSTADELLTHLRTHTASSSATTEGPSSGIPSSIPGAHPGLPPHPAASLYSSTFNSPMMQRTYPTPPLSPHSAARYNPAALYAAMVAGAKPPGPFPPPSPSAAAAAALAGYYPSPYSLYGPRIG